MGLHMVTAKKLNTPPNLPPIGRNGKLDIVHDTLPDPMQRGDDQVTARNMNHDVLEQEHKRGRLASKNDLDGNAAYAAGLKLQRAFELAGGYVSGGGQWSEGDRVDVCLSADRKMVRMIDGAREANELVDEILPVVGRFGFLVLQRALLKRETFHQIAAVFYFRPGKYEVWHVAESFRRGCRELADLWAAKGPERRR